MPRGWWRSHFVDHPLYHKNESKQSRSLDVWANVAQDKIKVFCKKCLEIRVGEIMQNEEDMARRDPGIFFPRTRDAIILSCAYFMSFM